MRPLGFSTGALAHGDFGRALAMLAGTSASAVELSALRNVEFASVFNHIMTTDLSRFAYVAMHAPTDAPDEPALLRDLARIAQRGIHIVVHPDVIRNEAQWASLDGWLCIENMDSRKQTGRTVEELRPIFQKLPAARLCFDIGHARQVDPTMTEAWRILRAFGGRLSHLHVSEVDGCGVHHEVSYGAALAFREVADGIGAEIPAIIESPVPASAMEHEMEVASSILDTAARAAPAA
jgi:hypothetical protein